MQIELKNITFKYADYSPIFKDFSLTINSGETIAIIGHNGSGKSTIAKIIMGLLKIESGAIWIDGEQIDDANYQNVRSKMGIIFQNPDNQFVGGSVKDDIAFGLENRCIERSEMEMRIKKYAQIVGMEDALDRTPETLSGGQKQRVAIAGALAMESELLIFDEATSMLDPEGVGEIIQMLRLLQREQNKTLVIITHNIEEALLADRIVVLEQGKIILDGAKETIFQARDRIEASGLSLPIGFEIYHELKNAQAKDALWQYLFKM